MIPNRIAPPRHILKPCKNMRVLTTYLRSHQPGPTSELAESSTKPQGHPMSTYVIMPVRNSGI